MLNILKDLTKAVDVVIVVGPPNIRSLLGVDVEDDAAIIYRGSTNECKIIASVSAKKYVEQVAPRECTIIAYSYDAHPIHGYALGKDFRNIVLGTLKSIARYSEYIGVPITYVDALMYSTLSKLWKIVDISRSVRVIRAKKKCDELDMFINVHGMIKKVLDECRKLGQHILDDCFMKLLAMFDGVYIEPLATTRNTYSLHLKAKKGIYRFSYRLAIPLDKDAENLISNINSNLEKVLKSYYTKQCVNLIKTIKTHVQYHATRVSLEVCGIGTEYCEYPTTSECLYEEVYFTNGMAIKIEVGANEIVFIPKLIVIKDSKVEVY